MVGSKELPNTEAGRGEVRNTAARMHGCICTKYVYTPTRVTRVTSAGVVGTAAVGYITYDTFAPFAYALAMYQVGLVPTCVHQTAHHQMSNHQMSIKYPSKGFWQRNKNKRPASTKSTLATLPNAQLSSEFTVDACDAIVLLSPVCKLNPSSTNCDCCLRLHDAPLHLLSLYRTVKDATQQPPWCLPLLVLGHTFLGEQFLAKASLSTQLTGQRLCFPACHVGDSVYQTLRLVSIQRGFVHKLRRQPIVQAGLVNMLLPSSIFTARQP